MIRFFIKLAFILSSLILGGSAFTPLTFKAQSVARATCLYDAYVPDGLTKEEYDKIKKQEKMQKHGKDLGRLGPRGFKSRSLQAWQNAYEKGDAGHTFAPIGFRESILKGLMRLEEVPYMVRGGSWDNSDVKGAKKLKWSKLDKDYAKGGYKKEQSASLLGYGPGLDWTGTQPRSGETRKSGPGFS